MTSPGRVRGWVARHPWLLVLVLMAAGNVGAWRAIEAEQRARAKDQCVAGAETRRVLRDMSYDVGVASGVAGGEALILSVGDADAGEVAAYRANLVGQLGPALRRIVERLPDREWDAEAGVCVDVPVGEGS